MAQALSPDQVIASDAFHDYQAKNLPGMSRGPAFERFTVNQVALRRQELGLSDIESGICGDKNDGGIDGFYIFLNGQELVQTDSKRVTNRKNALDGLQRGVAIDIVILQAKTEVTWETNVFPKIESALKEIFRRDLTAASLRAFPLNDEVVEKALLLQKLRRKLSPLVPVTRITVQYVTLAQQTQVNTYMETKRAQLEATLAGLLPTDSEITVEYVGDAEVVKRIRVSNDFDATLTFAKAPVRVGTALVGLVSLSDYLAFLRKEGNVLREELFAVNVRDFAGAGTAVNNAIASTLASDTATEFWWLNNGITIIANDAVDPIELEWTLTNPLIVNGLQTSNVIHESDLAGLVTQGRLAEMVLVRIIKESNAVVREAIISGTNNQTAIASIQLHANEEKQLRIEEYLRHDGWYYERRRFQYRGTTAPASKVRTVTDLAQAVMAYRLLEPDTARARPRSLLGTRHGWDRVFDSSQSEVLFSKALEVAEAVDLYLKTPGAKAIADDATNGRHYLVAGYALRSSNVKTLVDFDNVPTAALIATPSTPALKEIHELLYSEVKKLDDGKIARDQIFKGTKLKSGFFAEILKLNA